MARACFQAGSAVCAAAIARRVSAAPSLGTSATVSPVAGLTTANVSPESASTQAPSTYAWRRRRSLTITVMRKTIEDAHRRPRASSGRDNPERVDPQFIRFDDVRSFMLTEGVSGRPLFGELGMLNLIDFEPGSVVPTHSHPHEQLGIVLRGMQALVIDGVPHELGPFEGYVLPGGVEHSAYCGPEGALVLDVFSPVREDYVQRWQDSE